MDENEMRALFRTVLPQNTHSSSSSSSSSSDGSVSSATTVSPPRSPAPNPPIPASSETAQREDNNLDVASSDADTVEPEDYIPPTPPPNPASVLNRPGIATPTQSVKVETKTGGAESPSSSASTVPPPSPAVLARFQLTSFESAQEAVVVEVDERGIDGYEADEAERGQRVENEDGGCEYPKLEKGKFRFVEEGEVKEMKLSDRGGDGALPKEIVKCLSKYQRDGVTFMYRLWERSRGGLLADAMGLGKTIQAVCFLAAAFGGWKKSRQSAAKILIVAPASVGENWKKEIAAWTPFRVALYRSYEEGTIGRALSNDEINIVVAGDSVLGKEKEGSKEKDGNVWFRRPYAKVDFKWDVVIVDEIHVAKNKRTNTYKALRKLPKRVMFGLTGTAVQNRLMDLWAVMSLVVPDELWIDEKTFRKEFVDVINRGTKKDASEYMVRRAMEKIMLLRKILAKHILRRPKSVIEDHLPGKTDWCVMMRMKKDGLQGYMYQRFQNSYDVKLLRDARESCDCGSEMMSKECCHRFPNTREHLRNSPIWKMHHENRKPCERCPNCICLYLQHYSRLLSAHALLILPEESEQDQDKADFRRKLFTYYLGDRAHRAREPLHELEQDTDISCKLNVALKLLKSYEKAGHKTIIFYESLRLGEILRHWAINKGLMHEVIDGSVNKDQRQGAVDRFNKNSVVPFFFISKKAGGTGLNICGADRVLIFEPCWNPTLDLQAGDRAHRLGQKRVVQVIRLVVENTVEHYVFKTAITKSQISSAILDNTKEEWRIRDDEVGSMHAMLRMGDVFARPDTGSDHFEVVEAAKIDKRANTESRLSNEKKRQSRPESLLSGPREESQEELDVFGDEVIGSLEVDVDSLPWSSSHSDIDEPDMECGPAMPDSQFETDMLLEEEGAAGKLIVTSTSARKQKRQLMGSNARKRDSGINPGGVMGMNFDDAALGKIALSQEQDEESVHEDHANNVRPCRQARSNIGKAYQPSFDSKLNNNADRYARPLHTDDVIQLSDESDESIEVKRRRRRIASVEPPPSPREHSRRKDIHSLRETKRTEPYRRNELRPPIPKRPPTAPVDPKPKKAKRAPTGGTAKAGAEKAVVKKSAFAARARVRR